MKLNIMRLLRRCSSFLFASVLCINCYSADVLFLHSSDMQFGMQERSLRAAADFYGIGVRAFRVTGDRADFRRAALIARDTAVVGVVADITAMPLLDQRALLMSLSRPPEKSIPLFIVGVAPETEAQLLKEWTVGAVAECIPVSGIAPPKSYVFSRDVSLTRQLAGLTLPSTAQPRCAFAPTNNPIAQPVISIPTPGGELAVFTRTQVRGVDVFVSSAIDGIEGASGQQPDLLAAFVPVAAELLFLRYAGGDQAWHASRHYANLTIDDAWLTESYGFLNYRSLLAEMQHRRFHTTIAMVPWNFDRSSPTVASLVRSNPDHFSICVHGNNHDHREFADYSTKPEAAHNFNIKQALARMDAFSIATGIPYDRVMVFPHGISPAPTLRELKRYNYMATVNALNIPMYSAAPPGRGFVLRSATLAFNNFLSLRRYASEFSFSDYPHDFTIPKHLIAIDAFLDNPILFYAHHGLFASGINSFNPVADFVNTLAPDTDWKSLGYIAEHLYLVKRRATSTYDVLLFSSHSRLENLTADSDVTYLVRKPEDAVPPIKTVTVDGVPHTYELSDGFLRLALKVPSGRSRYLAIQYSNDRDDSRMALSGSSFRVTLLRRISDFRDIYLARTPLGRTAIRYYYGYHVNNTRRRLAFTMLLLVPCVVVVYIVFRYRHRLSSLTGLEQQHRS